MAFSASNSDFIGKWQPSPRTMWGKMNNAARSWTSSVHHQTGMRALKWSYGGLMGKAFLGLAAYEGYKKEGVWGAMKETAVSAGQMYALGAVWPTVSTVGAFAGGMAVGLGGIALGAHLATGGSPLDLVRPWVNEHIKRHTQLEMATPVIDNFGNTATMRQRSLMAIQNSRLNGRTALGNEAALSYTPYFR